MATDTAIYRGEDKLITLTVKDSAGNAVDLTTYAGVICEVVSKGGQIIDKFSRETLSGYNDTDFTQLAQTGATLGQFTIKLQSAKTKPAIEGRIYFETKLETTDADYTGSTKHDVIITEKDSNGKFIILQNAKTKDTTALT